MRDYYVYILSSETNKVFYIGVTNNLTRRIYEHKEGIADGFTKKYKVKKLLYFETFSDPENAIMREKKLKKWRRLWKEDLIKKDNPNFEDLYPDLIDAGSSPA